MHKHSLLGFLVLLSAVALAGCATVEVYTSRPAVQRASNNYFDAELRPQLQEGQHFFTSFHLLLNNKTDKDLHIDWENSYYLLRGRKHGRFLWEGVDWDKLKQIRSQPLVPVPAHGTFSQVIFPAKLVGRASTASGIQYTRGILPAGENGILLVVRQDDKKIEETIRVEIKIEPSS